MAGANVKPQSIESPTDFTKPFPGTDVAFQIEAKILFSTRAFLAMHSTYFARMFSEEWAASIEVLPNGAIPLRDRKFDDFHALLKLLKRSPEMGPVINDENVGKILALADEYDLQHVAGECAEYMLSRWEKKPERALQAVALADKYGLQRLKEAFIPLAALSNFSAIEQFMPPTLTAETYAVILHCHMKRTTDAFRSRRTNNEFGENRRIFNEFAERLDANKIVCLCCGYSFFRGDSYSVCSCTKHDEPLSKELLAILRKGKAAPAKI